MQEVGKCREAQSIACRGDSISGLRIKWSWVLDSTDLNGHPICFYTTPPTKGLKALCAAPEGPAGRLLLCSGSQKYLRRLDFQKRKDKKELRSSGALSFLFEVGPAASGPTTSKEAGWLGV